MNTFDSAKASLSMTGLAILLFSLTNCFGAEDESSSTEIILPSSATKFLSTISGTLNNLPNASRKAGLDLVKATSKESVRLMGNARKAFNKDFELTLKRIEKTSQNIAISWKHESLNLMDSATTLMFLKFGFSLIISLGMILEFPYALQYLQIPPRITQVFDLFNILEETEYQHGGRWLLVFGLIGFLSVQKILEELEQLNTYAAYYIQSSKTKVHNVFKKLLSSKKQQLLPVNKDEIHKSAATRSNTESVVDGIDEETELALAAASGSSASPAQPSLDDILNTALDELDDHDSAL